MSDRLLLAEKMDRSLECSGLDPGILLLEAVPGTLRVDGVLEAAGRW